MLNPQ